MNYQPPRKTQIAPITEAIVNELQAQVEKSEIPAPQKRKKLCQCH
ncbi:hypothetical protein [Actinobacillus suis]